MKRRVVLVRALVTLLFAVGCTTDRAKAFDAGTRDAGRTASGGQHHEYDGGGGGAGATDASAGGTGATDAGSGGAGATDAGSGGAAMSDGGNAPPDAEIPPDGLTPLDVSVLFPLPSSLASKNALRLDSSGAQGALLDRDTFSQITDFSGDTALAYENFRIVALRVDPCFPDLGALDTDPSRCRRQIRLVAQPLEDAAPGTSAQDSAIHLLYELDSDGFQDVIQTLLELRGTRKAGPGVPLGVSPKLLAEGESGSTAAALRALVLRHAGMQSLARFTFLHGTFAVWTFGGFDVQSGAVTPIAIAGIASTDDHQERRQTSSTGGGPVTLEPGTATTAALGPLTGQLACAPGAAGCQNIVLPGTDAEIRAALGRALDVENPIRENAESVDCASCHLASKLRERAESMGRSTKGLLRFESRWDLDLVIPDAVVGNPRELRAFGYHGTNAVLSQRVVNESAAVADALNRMH